MNYYLPSQEGLCLFIIIIVIIVVVSLVIGLFFLIKGGIPHRSGFEFQTAVPSVLSVMYRVHYLYICIYKCIIIIIIIIISLGRLWT